ncbi:MAG: hypothetical protein OM95_11240 [Bdellovibrio sp. ArHS]|uniref:cysteine rich repeat-containing protein n=1 Tax=Bdellovibrio sp. ArHS TaxID=1569284 RepID=UPI000583D3E9|nr:cysteine rich repeat-containing protein [Bdellovibrio sp. ArHS]KHD88084.1 MAG: hypothetical protein OM95_11240 [Bdellovibrio sp. ArHS]
MKEQVIAGMLTLSLALGFIFSIEVLAQNNRSLLDPCVSELQKFCQNAEPGGGAFLTCLDENSEKLSEDCRTRRVVKCLRDHTTDLSNACKVGLDNSLQNKKNQLQSQWP